MKNKLKLVECGLSEYRVVEESVDGQTDTGFMIRLSDGCFVIDDGEDEQAGVYSSPEHALAEIVEDMYRTSGRGQS